MWEICWRIQGDVTIAPDWVCDEPAPVNKNQTELEMKYKHFRR